MRLAGEGGLMGTPGKGGSCWAGDSSGGKGCTLSPQQPTLTAPGGQVLWPTALSDWRV